MLREFEYTKAFRQGEILIFKLKKKPDFYGRPPIRVRNGVIRVGEKEGHEHKVNGNGQLSMFDNKEDGIIEVPKGETATVTHPEHKDVKLEAGTYAVKTQKEATGKRTHSSVKD